MNLGFQSQNELQYWSLIHKFYAMTLSFFHHDTTNVDPVIPHHGYGPCHYVYEIFQKSQNLQNFGSFIICFEIFFSVHHRSSGLSFLGPKSTLWLSIWHTLAKLRVGFTKKWGFHFEIHHFSQTRHILTLPQWIYQICMGIWPKWVWCWTSQMGLMLNENL